MREFSCAMWHKKERIIITLNLNCYQKFYWQFKSVHCFHLSHSLAGVHTHIFIEKSSHFHVISINQVKNAESRREAHSLIIYHSFNFIYTRQRDKMAWAQETRHLNNIIFLLIRIINNDVNWINVKSYYMLLMPWLYGIIVNIFFTLLTRLYAMQ